MHRIDSKMKNFVYATIEMTGLNGSTRFRWRLLTGISVALICLVTGAVEAQEAEGADDVGSTIATRPVDYDPDLDSWIFSAAFEVGVLGYNPKASMAGTDLDPDAPIATNIFPPNDGPSTVIEASFDRGRVVNALVGVDFEIMAPRLSRFTWVPRPFLDVNISAAVGAERTIVRNRNPEPNEFEIPPGLENRSPIGANLIRGGGEAVQQQQQGPAVFIGIGGAYTFDLDSGSRLRVKPSLVYSRTPVDVSGIVSRVVRTANVTIDLELDEAFRFIVLNDKVTEVYHGIGPAVEFELDTNNRLGPFELSLFLKGHANYTFGDLDTDLSASSSEFPSETATFRYEHERWSYRASTGIRFRLVGEK